MKATRSAGGANEVARAAELLEARFTAAGDADSARAQKAYMKSVLDFHGVSSADVRAGALAVLASRPEWDHDGLVGVVDGLTASPWFDVRSAALVMLERKRKLLVPGDVPWLIELVRRGACWAHVDLVATNVVGAVLAAHPRELRWVRTWAADDDFWVRRTALLAQERELSRGRGDFELFAAIAAPMLPEKEFFIRKAIGWVLRSTSKRRPELAYRFLRAHLDRVSGLTLREGAKYLTPEMRERLGLRAARS